MFTRKRRLEITVFEYERIVARRLRAYCPPCRTITEMLTLEEAGRLAGLNVENICLRLADGTLHAKTLSNGEYRVCMNSLFSQN
jgi:hypothetical protein